MYDYLSLQNFTNKHKVRVPCYFYHKIKLSLEGYFLSFTTRFTPGVYGKVTAVSLKALY